MNDLQQYLIQEFVADYKDGFMSRRGMMRRVLYITGGVASTATLLSAMGCGSPAATPTTAPATKPTTAPTTAAPPAASPAVAVSPSPAALASPPAVASPSPSPMAVSPLSVAANDPAIEAASITFPGEGVTLLAYQAKPRGNGPFPLVLVCHENRGLTDHIRDVARRYAKEGYVACGLDLLSREGGTDKVTDPAQFGALLSNVPPERHVGDFQAALRHYTSQPIVRSGAYGMTGFCIGGGIVWRTATKMPELKAAAPYYGSPPPLGEVPGIKAAVLGVYSSDPQDGANNGKAELEEALKQANVTYQLKSYPDSFHVFNNDTSPRYNEAAALAAWKDVQDWFTKYLKA